MNDKPSRIPNWFRDALVTAAAGALVTIGLKFADLPTRISVVETRTNGIDTRLASMDSKLDALLERSR